MYVKPLSTDRGFAVTLRRGMHNNLKDAISCKHDTVSVVLYVHEVPLDLEPSDMDRCHVVLNPTLVLFSRIRKSWANVYMTENGCKAYLYTPYKPPESHQPEHPFQSLPGDGGWERK